MATAEDVERQIAVAVVVAVEEPTFLVPVQRIVGRIEVEHDLLRRLGVGVEKQVDEAAARSTAARARSADSGRSPPCRAPAGSACSCRRAARNAHVGLEPPEHHAHDRIVPQLVVIDQVLVAESDAEHPLAQQRRACRERLRSPARPSVKHRGEPLDQPDRPIRRRPSSNAPAFDVIAPPSKSATTRRPSTGAKPIAFALHSVGIGEPSCVGSTLCRRKTFPRSGPRCTYLW